ncbi:unnamed protein product, partial [Allacma fusca]
RTLAAVAAEKAKRFSRRKNFSYHFHSSLISGTSRSQSTSPLLSHPLHRASPREGGESKRISFYVETLIIIALSSVG